MNIVRATSFILAILAGAFLIMFGEHDDSPGAQFLGLLAVIAGIGGMVKLVRKRSRASNQ